MGKVSRRRLAAVTAQLLHERPGDQSRILKMLASYLVEHNQQKQVDLLLLDLARELARTNGHLYADVSSAHPLTELARKELTSYLKGATGTKTVELNEQIDADLLAGAVVRTAELELDTSARTKLMRLRNLNVNARDIGE